MNGTEHLGRPARNDSSEQTMFMTRPPLYMPVNLADWVPPQKIGEWIIEAIRDLDPSKPGVFKFFQQPPEQRPKVLLSVLVFCYLTQRFEPNEIFRACESDPIVKGLCEGKTPNEELDHFRRTHREILKYVLGRVLIKAVQEKFPDVGRLPPGLEQGLFDRAIDQLDTIRHFSDSSP